MKTNFFLFIIILVIFHSSKLNATLQEDQIWKLMNQNAITISHFQKTQTISGRTLILLEMNFSQADWMTAKASIPRGSIIESVELISSTFALNPTFDQDKLDRLRLHKLELLQPGLFNDERTEWKRVHETDGTSVESSRNLFHGFALIIREPASPASIAIEIKTLADEFISPKVVKEKPCEKDKTAKEEHRMSEIYVSGKEPIFEGDTLVDFHTDPLTARISGVSYTSDKRIVSRFESKPYTYVASASSYSFMTSGFSSFADSTVTAIFRRNKQWKEMLVVTDITGSMSPYTAQLLAWYKLNTMNGRVKNFVFFNDGDMKPDNEKVAGSTGGLYGIVASEFDSVVSTAINAMMHGGGGDTPENNIEALEYGLTNYGDAKEIVMIADNWATPRDLAFAGNIKRPVHIIVCGAAWGINVEYLNLARKTGGSVHTMEQDLTDLAKMNAGETISIGKFKYLLGKDGTFTLISPSSIEVHSGRAY